MMERKFKLVAWTENITDSQKARLYMTPSLESEVQADLIADLILVRKEEYKFNGPVSLDLARRAIQAYENMSRFEIFTGHSGDGIRYLFFAARYCIELEGLRHDLVRLCNEALRLAEKFGREDILQEPTPRLMLDASS